MPAFVFWFELYSNLDVEGLLSVCEEIYLPLAPIFYMFVRLSIWIN